MNKVNQGKAQTQLEALGPDAEVLSLDPWEGAWQGLSRRSR